MEAEILERLNTIQTLLWAILAVSILCAAFLIFGVVGRNLKSLESLKRDHYVSEAKGLEDRGEFDELVLLSKSRLEKYPKDIFAWYYLAIARLRNKNYQGALEAFSEIQAIDPHWQSEIVQEYIDDVRGSMRGPGSP